MCALAAPSWNERLPGALVALVVQVALFVLLLHSFQPVTRQGDAESQTIFLMPRLLPRPVPVIDARGSPRPAPSAAPSLPVTDIPPPPPYTQAAPSNPALLTALRGALACEPDAHGRPSPLMSCRGFRPAPRSEMAALAPALPMAREAEFAAEKARANTPGRVPCVSMRSNSMGFGQNEQEISVNLVCVLEEMAK